MSVNQLELIGYCMYFFVNIDNITYFDSFGVDNISKEIRKFVDNKYLYNTSIRFNNVWIHLIMHI